MGGGGIHSCGGLQINNWDPHLLNGGPKMYSYVPLEDMQNMFS